MATLAPLIATYAAVLKYACSKLADGEVVSRSQFSAAALKWLREAAVHSTSAVGVVPSQLLVQHAVEALVEEGCLAALDEGAQLFYLFQLVLIEGEVSMAAQQPEQAIPFQLHPDPVF